MDKHPVPPARRQRMEHAIRIVDMMVYAAVFGGGLYAALVPSTTVFVDVVHDNQWLLGLWTILLLGGGLVGFIGRLTRYWLVENPATVASAFGICIYLVVVSQYALQSLTAGTGVLLLVAALGFMVRRWFELQIFATEPDQSWQTRLLTAWRRHTPDVVHRDI